MRHFQHRSFRRQATLLRHQFLQDGGLPTTSSLVETLVGEVNARVKSKQKHWTRPVGAESILQLRVAVLSQDDRLPRFFAERPGCPFRKRDTLSHGSEDAKAQIVA